MKRPLMGLAVAYASGIWIGSLVSWPLVALIVSVAGLLAAFLFLHRTRFGLITLLTAVFATGILGYRQAATISPPNDITRLLERRDQNVDVQGVIVSDTGYRDDQLVNTGDVKQQRFDLELRALQCDGQWRPASGRILVFISEPREARPLRYGDLITFSAVLRVPPPVLNPGAFDARAWLARRDINFTATISQEDSIEVDAHDQGNPVIALSLGLRERLERALRLGLEDEPKLAGVLAGMVIGERSEIPQETYADFQHTGVFHVFAINGLHVGLVTAVVIIALRLVRIPRRWCGLVGIPLVALYVFATGAHPGAIRALVMASVWMLSWMLVRPADSLNTLAAAALVILLWDPTQLFDGGFLLSFIVVAAIVVLTPRIEKPLNRWVAPDPFLPRRFVSRWRRMGESTTRHGVRLLGCSLAAWVGLVPLLAVYFHLFTPVSIVANLLVIPLLTAIISLGLMATLAHAVWPWLTLTLNNANLLLLAIMTRSVGCLSEMPLGHWYVQAPPMGLVVAYYALGLALLSRWIRWRWRLTILVLAIPITGAAFF